jgi:arabinose-5-phosphate isomerase
MNSEILESGKRVIRIEREAIEALEHRVGARFEKAVSLILNCKGRVIVTGMGKSGAIGKKISSTLSSTGTTSLFLHPAEGVHGDLGMVMKGDIVIAISKSGETAELINLLPAFKRIDIQLIAMTGNAHSTLSKNADVSLDISVKEEACPNDLAPTASTTITLVMGDALAVALLEARGFSKDDFALLHPAGSLGKKLLLRVEDIMEKNEELPYCFENENMKRAVMEMAHKRGICPVIDNDFNLKGVVTTGDLSRLLEKGENVFHIPVTEVMNTAPITIEASRLATIAYAMMQKHSIISIPVLNDQKQLSGIVHLHDLMKEGIS